MWLLLAGTSDGIGVQSFGSLYHCGCCFRACCHREYMTELYKSGVGLRLCKGCIALVPCAPCDARWPQHNVRTTPVRGAWSMVVCRTPKLLSWRPNHCGIPILWVVVYILLNAV
jgi:hypothetical protein